MPMLSHFQQMWVMFVRKLLKKGRPTRRGLCKRRSKHQDHKISKKHTKNVNEARTGKATGSHQREVEKVAQPSEPNQIPKKENEAWNWLEAGKKEKEQAADTAKPESGEPDKTRATITRKTKKVLQRL